MKPIADSCSGQCRNEGFSIIRPQKRREQPHIIDDIVPRECEACGVVRRANIVTCPVERIILPRGQLTLSGRDHEHGARAIVHSDQFAVLIKWRPERGRFQARALLWQFQPFL